MSKLYPLIGTLLTMLLLPAFAQHPTDTHPGDQPSAALVWQTRAQWAPADLTQADYIISNAYTEASGLTYAYPQQLSAGLPVYNQIVTLVFKGGQLRHHAGAFLPANAFAGQPTRPSVPAATAVATALASTPARKEAVRPVALDEAQGVAQRQTFAPASVARRPIEARLVWAVVQGQPRLAWNVNVELIATPDWLNIRVDAATGRVLAQDNWTVNEATAHPTKGATGRPRQKQLQLATAQPARHLASPARVQTVTPASYLVVPMPNERPDVTPLSLVTNPWLNAGAGNNAATYGWHFDGTTDYTDTRGNNVWAYDDSLKKNAPGRFAAATSTGSSLGFNYVPDFTKVPTLGKNRRAATVNLFYWNNLMHDVFYQYGFTEAAGNFQTSNLGRGGTGGDYVKAEAQDGGGTNNANFATPADGTSGRMQMYLFTYTTPGRDGDFDSGVMSHEYGHGISNRLTGGPANSSCLDNAEQAGEGWSDYFALMMTTNWANTPLTDATRSRPVGTYVVGQSATATGIRRYPYTTDISVNPLTYADLALSPEVHDIGEIWCVTLWDLTWALIQQQGSIEPNIYNSASTGGNVIALNLVMQGLKMQPCSPGFLDSRDAILAADNLLYNGQYHCLIQTVFARRGMGTSAVQGSSNQTNDQVAAFDGGVELLKNTTPVSGTQFTITLQVRAGCLLPGRAYTLTDQLPAGLQYLSSTGGTLGSNNTVTFSNLSLTAGQTATYQIQAQTQLGSGCYSTTALNDDRDANTTGGLTPAVVSGANAWAVSTLRAHSGTNAWRAPDVATTSDVTLTSSALPVGNFSQLSFYQYYNSETGYDGGLVAISTDNGVTWIDAAPYFTQNGYNQTFYSGTASAGKRCFSGVSSSATGAASFSQSVLDLSAFNGQSVRVRFQYQTDNTNTGSTYTGWFLDDILLTNSCGGTQRVQLTDNKGNAVGAYLTPTYLLPQPLYLTGVSPTDNTIAAPVGSSLMLNFNQPVTTATASNVHVFSFQRGGQLVRPGGATVTGGGTATVTIDPAVDFRPGETVRVSVPATVQAPTGTSSFTQVYQFTAGVSAASPGTFGNNLTQTGFSATARSLAVADFTNDGHLDVLTAGRGSSGNVSLALGTGSGQLAAPTLLTMGSDLTSVVPADFNEDGNLDFAAVQNVIGNGVVYIQLGSGSGTFTSAANVAVGSGARNAVAADVNADGHLDLLVTNQNDNSVSVCLGAGNGTFTVAAPVTGLVTAENLAVGDINNDGKADFVASNFAANGLLYVRLGNGDGTFTSAADVAVTGQPRGVVLADFNADQRLDVAVAGFTNPSYLSVRLGDGTGAFAGGADLPAGVPSGSLSAGDVDGDGDLDLVTTESAGQARYYVNTSGSFAARPVVPVAGSLNAHALVDMDEDGDLDLVTVSNASTNTATATVVFNRPAEPLPVQLLSFTAQAQGPAAVRLAWATASELNSARFEIERSADGATFAQIGQVPAAGSSAAAHSYGLLDNALPVGSTLLYYRLRQVDFDGSAHYSPVRAVALTAATAGLALYPNPTQQLATLTGAAPNAAVQVFDALGRVVATATAAADGTVALTLPTGLASGVYVVRTGSHALRLLVDR